MLRRNGRWVERYGRRLRSFGQSNKPLWHHGSFLGLFLLALSIARVQAEDSFLSATIASAADVLTAQRPSAAAIGTSVESAARRPNYLLIAADGRKVRQRTLASTVAATLAEAGLQLGYGDLVMLDGRLVSESDLLSYTRQTSLVGPITDVLAAIPGVLGKEPDMRLEVQRPMLVQLHDGPFTATIPTRETQVDAILAEAGTRVYPEDVVSPSLDSTVGTGGHIIIERSRPVTLQTKDGVQKLRTLLPTVGDLLAAQGITLGPLDWALPEVDSPIQWDMPVRVVRVSHKVWTEDESVSFVERTQMDPEVELDQMQVTRGQVGLLRHTVRAIIHDGQEVARQREGTETVVEKRDHVTSYGTKIVWRTVDTPDGPKEYWRRFRVWATSYNASHGGKDPGSPGYGITATGMLAGRGVVAVDPSVIPLYSRLYVPGYGTAVAGDTGGAVKGRIVDLGFPEDVTNGWGARYVDVYLLGPMPSWFPLHLP